MAVGVGEVAEIQEATGLNQRANKHSDKKC